MSRRRWVALSAGFLVLVCAFLLITASPLINIRFPGIAALPLGTLIAWIGLIALPLGIYAMLDRLHPAQGRLDRGMLFALRVMIAAALAWAPVSYWLAGNPAFVFDQVTGFQGSEAALFAFFYFSMALTVLPLGALALYWLLSLIPSRKV